MKNAFLGLFLLLTVAINAQDAKQTAQNHIAVSGIGEILVTPDRALISITAKGESMQYEEAMSQLNSRLAALKKSLNGAGFDDSEIKQKGLRVNRKNRYRDGKSEFDGYVATQTLVLEIENNSKTIQLALNGLIHKESQTDFSLSFFISDEMRKKTQKDLLKRAMEHAKSKAVVLTGAAGVSLGSIQKIQHNESNGYSQRPRMMGEMSGMAYDGAKSAASSFEADAIKLTERVEVRWGIQ